MQIKSTQKMKELIEKSNFTKYVWPSDLLNIKHSYPLELQRQLEMKSSKISNLFTVGRILNVI